MKPESAERVGEYAKAAGAFRFVVVDEFLSASLTQSWP